MSAKAERPKNRIVKLVGGGTRRTRQGTTAKTGGSLKAQRRALRQTIKNKRDLNPENRRALKKQLADMLARKDGR